MQILNLVREISLSFGQPSMIAATPKGIKLPSPIDDEFLSDDTGKSKAQPRNTPSLLEYYIQTIKLYQLLKKVVDTTETSIQHSGELMSRIQAMSRLHKLIMEWRDRLPPYLKFEEEVEDCDAARTTTSDEIFRNPREPLGLADLSKRLFCRLDNISAPMVMILTVLRFLHTIQLTLRPALELLFERQHVVRPNSGDISMEARLQELMLSDIASQCVLFAVQLNDFLSSQIQSQGFACWWYNTSCQ